MDKFLKVITFLYVIFNLLLMAYLHLIFVGMSTMTNELNSNNIFGIISFLNIVLMSIVSFKKPKLALVIFGYDLILLAFFFLEAYVFLAIIVGLVFVAELFLLGRYLYKRSQKDKQAV